MVKTPKKTAGTKTSPKKSVPPKIGPKRDLASVGVENVIAFVKRLIAAGDDTTFAKAAKKKKLTVKVDSDLQDFIVEYNTRPKSIAPMAGTRRGGEDEPDDPCRDHPNQCFKR